MPASPRPWSPLPAADVLARYQIWDSYFTPSSGASLIQSIEQTLPLIERVVFAKLCYFPSVGLKGRGKAADADAELEPLRRWPDLMLAMMELNANDLESSMEALNRWMRDGPMIGVYLPGSSPGGLTCSDSRLDPLVERIAENDGAIMVHTWFKTGEERGPHASTPSDLVALAARFPAQTFICAHAGGNWELGIRAVSSSPNIVVETSGFDATAGFVEMAVRELGAERVVFGSHLPSRSLGTELSKVLFAQITEAEKQLILGANFRRLLRMG